MDTNAIILLIGALLFVSILATQLSFRYGFPFLLVFLGIGMLAGEDGLGGIIFNDFGVAYFVGNLALAVILLDGGLRTSVATFRIVAGPAVALATVGVIATASAVAVFSAYLLDLDWRSALLLGSIVGSTDAAAVFGLLRQTATRLNERVAATLEIESGANDPMAIFLVVLLVEWLSGGPAPGPAGVALTLLAQLAFGALGGVAGGYVLSVLLARIRLVEGLYALLVVSGSLALFAIINQVGGSGFLAIYLAGIMIANRRTHATEHVLSVMDGLAWLSQAGMFLILGLLVTPSSMALDAPAAILVALFLMLVARPAAVFATLIPFRLPVREMGFMSWVGLRGAVPIILGVFPVIAGLENSMLLYHVTFAVVLVSLIAQGTTVGVSARLFGLQVPAIAKPLDRRELVLSPSVTLDLVQLRVEPDAPCVGRRPRELLERLYGENADATAIVRDDRVLFPDGQTRFASGDLAVLLVPHQQHDRLAAQFARLPVEGPLSERAFFGEFVLDGAAAVADVAGIYGIEVAPGEEPMTLAELMAARLERPLVPGDRLDLGRIVLTVLESEQGRAIKVGLKLGG